MGSFREHFVRSEKKDFLLNYDDTAFLYYILAILIIILVPWIFVLLKKVILSLVGLQSLPISYVCECTICEDKKKEHRKNTKFAWLNFGFFLQVLVIGILVYALFSVSKKATEESRSFKQFDPYEILEIPKNATISDIKTAYHVQTLKWHPDKNPDNPEAFAKFEFVRKAFESLASEEGRRNYEKYGNPDGPGALNIGIALPGFLLKKENQVAILIVFFVVLLVIIPGLGLYWYSSSSRYNEFGIDQDNIKKYAKWLNENLPLNKVGMVMAQTCEFSENLGVNYEELEHLNKLSSKIENGLPPKAFDQKVRKANLLLNAYLQHMEIEHPKLFADQSYILRMSQRVLAYLIQTALENSYFCKLIVKRLIKYSQYFFHGMTQGDSHFLQIPYLTRENLKMWQRKTKFKGTFKEYINLPKSEYKVDTFFENPVEQKDVYQALSNFPRLTMQVKYEVKGSDKFYEGELLLTIEVNLMKSYGEDSKESRTPHNIHSNCYPFPKQEMLWVFVVQPEHKRIIDYSKVHKQFVNTKKEYKILLEASGRMEFMVYAKFDCYRGLDCKEKIVIDVQKREKVEEKVIPDPDLDKPSMLSQIMGIFQPGAESDEEVEDEKKQEKVEKEKEKKKENEDEKLMEKEKKEQ